MISDVQGVFLVITGMIMGAFCCAMWFINREFEEDKMQMIELERKLKVMQLVGEMQSPIESQLQELSKRIEKLENPK